MIEVISIYEDVARDNVNTSENGVLNYETFNRLSRRAELRMLDYLTGDVESVRPPEPYISQKNNDWVSSFIVPFETGVKGGFIDRPENFYGYENMYLINKTAVPCEGEDEDLIQEDKNIPIELLQNQKFYRRQGTFIKSLKPSPSKPIAKMIGKRFEFAPKDLGSVVLEYYRYPVFAHIVQKEDKVYNNLIADEDASVNYEWNEQARELLVWFITDSFSTNTREQILKAMNQGVGKTVRDQK